MKDALTQQEIELPILLLIGNDRAMPFLSGAIHFAVACLMAALANWFGLIPWRKAVNAHWTERARLLWPVRINAGLNILFLPVILGLGHRAMFRGAYEWWVFDGVAALLGALLGSYPFDHEILPQMDFRSWRHHVVAGWGVRFGIYGALIAAAVLMPETFGLKALAIAAGYLAIHFAVQFGLFLKYLRLVKFMKPAGPRLQGIVNGAAARANVSVRATWQLSGVHALAYAFPTTRELAFSERLLEICNDEELTAICAHELAHLTESKMVLAGRLIGSLVFFPLIFLKPSIHAFDLPGMFLPYLGFFLIYQFSRRLSQRMEKRADNQALIAQADEGVYARALEKIYRENQIPAVNINDKQTHPHLYDRMLAAGITPEYPRPAKPDYLTSVALFCWIALGIGIGVMTALR